MLYCHQRQAMQVVTVRRYSDGSVVQEIQDFVCVCWEARGVFVPALC